MRDKTVGSATVRLSKKITRIINYYLKPYKVTTEQWGVLRTLAEKDHITQKQLAERTDKDQATLTKILDILVKNGFVERIANPTDRRSFLIKITESGVQLTEEVTPYLEKVFEKITMNINEMQLGIFEEVVLSLESNIDRLLQEENN